mmetsp:Transcript_42082/g.96642  ORF Transcript_42082/g.96642 Transcript_42082/m.96642 type:complete len:222 (-) Transcript_42082:1214-1879(-)
MTKQLPTTCTLLTGLREVAREYFCLVVHHKVVHKAMILITFQVLRRVVEVDHHIHKVLSITQNTSSMLPFAARIGTVHGEKCLIVFHRLRLRRAEAGLIHDIEILCAVLQHVPCLFSTAPTSGHVAGKITQMPTLMSCCWSNDAHCRAIHCIVHEAGDSTDTNAYADAIELRYGVIVQPHVHLRQSYLVLLCNCRDCCASGTVLDSSRVRVGAVQPLVRYE